MAARWNRTLATLSCAGLLVTGCAGSVDDRPGATPEPVTGPLTGSSTTAIPSPSELDTADLVARALTARSANDAEEFAALVTAAGTACPDPDGARRLGEAAAIAGRWAAALQFSRPKAQAITENQLAQVDWDALVSTCAAP